MYQKDSDNLTLGGRVTKDWATRNDDDPAKENAAKQAMDGCDKCQTFCNVM